MASIVEPTTDFQFDAATNSLTYLARRGSRLRTVIGALLIVPLMFVAVFGIAFGILDLSLPDHRPTPEILIGGIAAAVATAVVFWWARRKVVQPIIIDAKSITVGKKKYLLEHVSRIGFSGQTRSVIGGTGVHGGAAALGAAMGNEVNSYVFIIYGADEVPILKGLNPDQASFVCDRLTKFLEQSGYYFS